MTRLSETNEMMFQESVTFRQILFRRALIAAFIVVAQDLSSRGGAQAWTYTYSISPNRKWEEARQWCQENFIDMVATQNQEEVDYLNNLLPFNSKYYWTGIHRVAGVWTWTGTNKNLPKEAQNWAQDEPDKIANQDCVEIYIKREKDTAKWNNEKCHKRKGTVCYTASCAQNSCSVHADCEETVGNYTCQCHPGFTGPLCEEPIACKPLLDPNQGSHYCFDPFGPNRFNSSCHFHCELGFQLTGVPQVLCQATGHWNHPVPLCQVKPCPVLNHTSINRGSMNCSHPIAPYSFNSTCDVLCDEGYELSGQDHIRCDHTGQWTASVPACTIKKCPPILLPDMGIVTCVDTLEPFSFGSRCNFTCIEGYYLSGDSTLACLSSGQWSKPTPTCIVVKCNSLNAPPAASMQCQHPLGLYSYGSTCTVQCEEGFDLNGTNVTKCSAQGNWSHALPVCQAKSCSPINSPPHGSLSCSDSHGSFSFGSRCMTACDEGFLQNGTALTECTSQGIWSADIPHCLAKKCPALKSPIFGSLFCSDPHGKFSFGSQCTSSCEEGFLLNGTANTECTSLCTWTADIPHCLAQRCPSLNTPSYGSIVCSDPHEVFSFGSQCTSSCEEGFLLNGTANTECTSLGTWTADIPHCLAQRCPSLNTPSYGSIVCSDPHEVFSFGSQCTSSCDEGFVLNGTADTECTSLGMWSREISHCLARVCPLLDETPQHGKMNCSHPYFPFSYGSNCDFECNEGFSLKGSPAMTCNSSGHWNEDLPTCQPLQCEAIHSSSFLLSMNCSHPLGNFSFGSQCLFTCKEGFILNGTEMLICSSAGLWSDSLPTCIDIPVGTTMLLYTGVGASSVVITLILIGMALLILTRFKRRGKMIKSDVLTWEDRENPAFEF